MFEFVVTAIVSFVLYYFVVYFHECGHAFFAIILTKDKVKVRLGGAYDIKVFKIGRLIVCLNGFSPWYGSVHWNAKSLSNIKKVIIYLGGPIFSMILSSILWFLIRSNLLSYVNSSVLFFIFIVSLWQFIVTIIPIKYTKFYGPYKGMSSDGLNALNILFKN